MYTYKNKLLSYKIDLNVLRTKLNVQTCGEHIPRNSRQHGCQARAGCTHMDLNMAAKQRESVESTVMQTFPAFVNVVQNTAFPSL